MAKKSSLKDASVCQIGSCAGRVDGKAHKRLTQAAEAAHVGEARTGPPCPSKGGRDEEAIGEEYETPEKCLEPAPICGAGISVS